MTRFKLHNADCIDGMSRLEAASVDLIVTSPPYNLGVAYGSYSDGQDRGAYLDWLAKWGTEARRVLKPDGSLFLNIGASPANPLLPHELALRLRDIFVLQNTIHWIKSISVEAENGEVISRGHFKPINSPRYLNDCHEYVFHFTPEGRTPIDRLALGVPYQDKSNIARWEHTGGSDLRCRGNTWFVPYRTIKSRDEQRPHPATFPVELAVNCIKLHGIPRVQTMLDPFLGIGNSAVAAQQCRVPKFIGFEIDESYLTEAQRRLGAHASTLVRPAGVSPAG
ncbi:MAG TPA: site-specific DNA-methyltransferase [Chthoniobacterales bacterium]|nr:site-specific DNA-methyltransferase [Chthoniobacterales bacterium]